MALSLEAASPAGEDACEVAARTVDCHLAPQPVEKDALRFQSPWSNPRKDNRAIRPLLTIQSAFLDRDFRLLSTRLAGALIDMARLQSRSGHDSSDHEAIR